MTAILRRLLLGHLDWLVRFCYPEQVILRALARDVARRRADQHPSNTHTFPPGAIVLINAGYELLGDDGNAVETLLHVLYVCETPWEEAAEALDSLATTRREEAS